VIHTLSHPLSIAALSLGFIHTLAGPDHYLPFVAMSRAGRWTLRRTLAVTILCGVGHVFGSVLIGSVGIALGYGVEQIEVVEGTRGGVAGWLLIAFGLVYLIWGIRSAIGNRPHSHFHAHADGTVHSHSHVHLAEHTHVHAVSATADRPVPRAGGNVAAGIQPSLTPWILFTIFIFGPCEVLIPMLLVPASRGSLWGVAWVTFLFGAATLATMTAVVLAMRYGAGVLRFSLLERFGHAAAGAVVTCCGLAIKLGL